MQGWRDVCVLNKGSVCVHERYGMFQIQNTRTYELVQLSYEDICMLLHHAHQLCITDSCTPEDDGGEHF